MKAKDQIKLLRKEKKKLRKLLSKTAINRDHWKNMYEELDRYVEWQYKDY